ncbi:hypothetical protein ACLB2K_052955 [Fragaria x ananassa]
MSSSNNTFPTSSTTYPLNISLPDFTTSTTELSFRFFDTQQQQIQDTPSSDLQRSTCLASPRMMPLIGSLWLRDTSGHNGTLFQERIYTMTSHFGPTTSLWMNAFKHQHPNASWEMFVSEFLEHFDACNSADFKAVLSHLQQTSSVDAFITEFTTLSCCIPDWSNLDLLPIFIGGLNPELRHDVDVMQPQMLVAAQRMARCYEHKLAN